MLLVSQNFNTAFKKIISLDAENLGSVGYRPSNFENDSTPHKLDWFEWAQGQVAGVS